MFPSKENGEHSPTLALESKKIVRFIEFFYPYLSECRDFFESVRLTGFPSVPLPDVFIIFYLRGVDIVFSILSFSLRISIF